MTGTVSLDPAPSGETGSRRAVPSVLALPLASLACLVASVWLESGLVGDVASSPVTTAPGWYTSLTGVLLGGCAATILLRDRRQGLGWAMAWFGLIWAVDGAAESYMRLGLGEDQAYPGMTWAAWFVLRFTAILPATVAVLLAVFPDGRVMRGRWGAVVWVSLAFLVANGPLFVVIPSGDRLNAGNLPPGTDPDPTTIDALVPYTETVRSVLLGLSLVAILAVMAAVVVRYHRSRGIERDRMRWLAWAVTAMALLIGVDLFIDTGRFQSLLFFVVVNLGPVAMTIAVTAPRVVAIEDLLAGTLVFGALSTLLLTIDVLVVAALSQLLEDDLGQTELITVVLLLSVLLYGPLRSRLWTVVRRAMLGDRSNPYDVVAGLASTLERSPEGAEQLAAVAEAITGAFGIGYVRLEVDRSHGERLVATHGDRPGEVRTLPITYRGQEVGRVELPVRGLRSRLSRRDEELLGDLVRQAVTAVRTSQLADELQDSRERLVVAREEERRRIRRDLHDGLGPSLSGVVYQLESARLLVDQDPQSAQRSIASTSTLVQDVVADVRRLVHDLRPPALDDLGLVGALRQQAERLSASGLGTTVRSDDLGQLSAAVEVAAYRIVGEALTNVTRHASAQHVSVDLHVVDAHLVVEVVDDGGGIPADVQAGIGLVSLRERAAELGGRTEVSCPAQGGTVVRAWLPLSRKTSDGGEDAP